jgi:hypothetical protein
LLAQTYLNEIIPGTRSARLEIAFIPKRKAVP